ncbi:MAG TPA: phage major capsid protein [Urbifossiella sp.]|nr:phage major capsid protein [Urbifossiella sp.]
MPTANELRTQRAAVIAQSRQLIDKAGEEKRDMTAEESGNFDRAMADADRLAKEVRSAEQREQLEALEAEQRASAGRKVPPTPGTITVRGGEPSDYDRRESVRAWALAGTDHARTDADTLHRAAVCGIKLVSSTLSLRDLSKGTATAGGNAVPFGMVNVIERQLKFFAPIRGYASSLTTDSGIDIPYPRTSDIANSAAIVGENGNITAATDPTFDKVTMKAWKYATTIVKISVELLQDMSVDPEQLIGSMLGERMGRGQATDFVTGNGTTAPQGLAIGAAVGVNLITANPLTHDKVIDLIYSVDRAYRVATSAFMCHDDTVAALIKLKDTTGQYLWQPSVQAGEPDRLRNYPVLPSNDLTSINSPGDNQPLILFGDAKKYLIRDVRGSQQVTRLNELYAATGEVGFVLLQRTDGRYIGHSGCVKSLNSFDS